MRNRTHLSIALALIASLALAGSAGAAVIADSQADFTHTAQGVDNWYYGSYDNTTGDFVAMDPADDTFDWGETTGWVWAEDGNDFPYMSSTFMGAGEPGYDIYVEGVRRWISETDQSIDVDVRAYKIQTSTATGRDQVVSIIVDGTEVWSQEIKADDTTGYDLTVSGIDVALGSTVDFTIRPQDGEHNWAGRTYYTAVINEVPEPATMGLLGFGALGLLARRKRRA